MGEYKIGRKKSKINAWFYHALIEVNPKTKKGFRYRQ